MTGSLYLFLVNDKVIASKYFYSEDSAREYATKIAVAYEDSCEYIKPEFVESVSPDGRKISWTVDCEVSLGEKICFSFTVRATTREGAINLANKLIHPIAEIADVQPKLD